MQLMLYAKFQHAISSGSGEKVDFSGLGIFSNSGQLLIPNQPEFYYSEALQPFNVKFEYHGCSGFRE